jgi:hypothetical protein
VTGHRETGSSSPSAAALQTYYGEDYCALNLRLLLAGLFAPLGAVAVFVLMLALRVYSAWAGPVVAIIVLVGVWAVFGQMLPYVWPAGIRLDTEGIRIGGVRWAKKHPGRTRRSATVPHQYGQVFACSWNGVQRIGVTRNRKAIKVLVRGAAHGRRPTPLGNLAAPFMRAALVAWVERDHDTLPRISPARGLLSANWSSPGYHQPVWVVPTRHPGALEAALATVPLPPGTVSNPYPDADTDVTITEWQAP